MPRGFTKPRQLVNNQMMRATLEQKGRDLLNELGLGLARKSPKQVYIPGLGSPYLRTEVDVYIWVGRRADSIRQDRGLT